MAVQTQFIPYFKQNMQFRIGVSENVCILSLLPKILSEIDISNIELVRVHGRAVRAPVLRAKGVSFLWFESRLVPTFFFNF